MALVVNLRHLAAHDASLAGEVSVEELDIDARDEVIQVTRPLQYALEVQKLEGGLLLQGRLCLVLDCECVRCLKPFQYPLELKDWACHVPLEGEEQAPVVNDCVDLTPYVREDILLEFPRHPLCKSECRGLPKTLLGKAKNTRGKTETGSSAWAELNKLKF
jgi:uncharacterized protein